MVAQNELIFKELRFEKPEGSNTAFKLQWKGKKSDSSQFIETSELAFRL
jgi:hypothetical protein